MTLNKQTIVYNGAPSRGMTNTAAGGTIPPHVDFEHTTEDTCSSSQRTLPLYEGQILQMLADMKEQMKEQVQLDRDREQAALDRDNVACEEALK